MKPAREILRLMPSGQVVPEPARIGAEAIQVHEARIAAIKALGRKWVKHPAYQFDPRHSNDPEIYIQARAGHLQQVADLAAAARAKNPLFQRAERVRAAVGSDA